MFGKQAEIAGECLRKGSQVYTQSRLQKRKKTDKSNIGITSTEIIADRMQMLGNCSGRSSDYSDSGFKSRSLNQVIIRERMVAM